MVSPVGPRAVAAARCATGLALLVRPEPAARLLGAPPGGSHPVLRVLGARHLVVSLVGLSRPTREVATAAAAVDGIHAVTCLGLAAVSPRHRRTALRATASAMTWMAVT